MMTVADAWSAPRTLLAWIVGGVFIYAAALKILDPAEFAQSIKYYKLLPLSTVNALALILPWWELFAGLAMLVPAWRRAGGSIIFGMLCVFLGAVTSALARGLDISCGCFGTRSSSAGVQTLAIDLALLIATAAVLWYYPRVPDAFPLADASTDERAPAVSGGSPD